MNFSPSFQLHTIRLLHLHILFHPSSVCKSDSFFLTLRNLFYHSIFILSTAYIRRSRWLRGLRCASVASRLLGLRVRIPPGAWMSFCFQCCVLSGRGLCVGLITFLEKSYWVWCVWVWSWSLVNHLTPNDYFSGRTAPLTSRCCIFYFFNKYTYWIF